jgi:hypothetical protein
MTPTSLCFLLTVYREVCSIGGKTYMYIKKKGRGGQKGDKNE